jgi:MtN3 and saliva related transmembrane protein
MSGLQDPVVNDVIGILGGLLLVIALIPQILHIFKTKSAKDLSYSWLILYVLDLIFYIWYLLVLDALVGWITVLIELLAVMLMIFLKFYYDRRERRANKKTLDEESTMRLECDDKANQHRGFHIMYDFVFEPKDEYVTSLQLGEFVFATMIHACEEHNNNNKMNGVQHRYMKVFEEGQEDAGMSSSGFISVCLMDESHITAHCKSDMGLLTLDLFTCGSRPDITRAAGGTIKSKLMDCELFARIEERKMQCPESSEGLAKSDENSIVDDECTLSLDGDLEELSLVHTKQNYHNRC